jgi:DnaJ-class molecular chaperone
VTCQPCQGQGRTRCLHCDGGWKTCSSCHGQATSRRRSWN